MGHGGAADCLLSGAYDNPVHDGQLETAPGVCHGPYPFHVLIWMEAAAGSPFRHPVQQPLWPDHGEDL